MTAGAKLSAKAEALDEVSNPRARPNAGRKRGGQNSRTKRELISITNLAREFGPAALSRIVHLMKDGDSDAVKLRAAEVILDRAYGKAREHIDIQMAMKPDLNYRPADECIRDLAAQGIDLNVLFGKQSPLSLIGDDRPVDDDVVDLSASEYSERSDD